MLSIKRVLFATFGREFYVEVKTSSLFVSVVCSCYRVEKLLSCGNNTCFIQICEFQKLFVSFHFNNHYYSQESFKFARKLLEDISRHSLCHHQFVAMYPFIYLFFTRFTCKNITIVEVNIRVR